MRRAGKFAVTALLVAGGGLALYEGTKATLQTGDLRVAPVTNMDTNMPVGGPPDTTSWVYCIRNIGGQDCNYAVSLNTDDTWVSIAPSSGTLTRWAEPTSITVSTTADANALAPGYSHQAQVVFENTTDHVGDTSRTITINVAVDPNEPNEPNATYAGAITQYGITWTFDPNGPGPGGTYQVGQFVTGDWWVLDGGSGVGIASVDPAPTGTGASARHGSMIDPLPGNPVAPSQYGDAQSYDGRNGSYNSAKSVAFPVTITGTKSLISTMSFTTESFPYVDITGVGLASGATYTRSAAILTVVSAVPGANQFRPAYCGTTKTAYDANDINWALLPTLTTPSGAPNISTYATYFARPWLDHMTNWMGRAMHPADNMPNYGRELCGAVSDAACLLCCNYTTEQKRSLAIGLIQNGIDQAAIFTLAPTIWEVTAGQNPGRKFPVLFAGKLLEDAGLLAVNMAGSSEDTATYHGGDVSPAQTLFSLSGGAWVLADPNTDPNSYANPPTDENVLYVFCYVNRGTGHDLAYHENYTPTEWFSSPFPDPGSLWPAYKAASGYLGKHDPYRRICNVAMVGQTIAARILGLTTTWNHAAYFDYIDRWMYEDDSAYRAAVVAAGWDNTFNYNGGTAYSAFAAAMYTTYRPTY